MRSASADGSGGYSPRHSPGRLRCSKRCSLRDCCGLTSACCRRTQMIAVARAPRAHFVDSVRCRSTIRLDGQKERSMSGQDTTTAIQRTSAPNGAALWLWLSIAAAVLAATGSVIALAVRSVYAGLTPAFLPQALAQDVANLALASPALLILAALALRGSLRAYLLWLGVLTFTIYNYVIYALSIPFGPLFLPWVGVLGLCLFALIGGVVAVDHDRVAESFTNRRAVVVVAWSLIVVAVLFCL